MLRRSNALLVCLLLALTALPAMAADIPKPALDSYLRIQTSLAADSLADAKQAAQSLATQAGPLGPALKAAIAPAQALAGSPDIKAARAAFGELTDVMLKLAGDGTGGAGVRVAYCPMVKKSWLQTGGEIANPYYGASMLRCGTFTK